MVKTLKECKKCKKFKGMRKSLVRCSFNDDFVALVISVPSFYEPQIKNGTMIVLCNNY
jgi:hypothetical protein